MRADKQRPEAGNFLASSGVYTSVADVVASPWALADEDRELVSAVRAGSEQAFDCLVDRYHAAVYNLVYRMVGNPGDAADVVQEVFLKVYRGLEKFQAQSSLKTWIFRIAVHEGCNYRRWWRRRRSRETPLEVLEGNERQAQFLTAPGESPFEEAASRETALLVEDALARIPEAFRTAVVLRDLEDLDYDEIAQVLQVSVGTVKSRVSRGREALRRRLAVLREEPQRWLPSAGAAEVR